MIISKKRRLTKDEEVNLNRIDQLITKIMLKSEKNINNQQHNSLWSPELHDSIRTVFIWISILSQFKTKLSFQKQIDFYFSSLPSPISIEWTTFANIKYNLSRSQSQLRKNKINAKELRTQHLMQRFSAMNIAN